MASIRSRIEGTPDPDHVVLLRSGLEIAYDVWGPANGTPAVLLHGGGQTRHAWRGAGQRLSDAGYLAIAVDLRGHGDSAWAPDGDYGYDALVEDLVDFVGIVELQKPILVGASLGGAVALVAAGENLIDMGALVMVDTAPRLEPEGVSDLRSFMTSRPEGFDSLDEVADAIAAYNPNRKRSANPAGLGKNMRLDEHGKYHWHWDPRFMSQNHDPDHWELRQARMERCATSLALPTLLVRGGLSDLLSEEGANGFLELCPHAEYVNITGASHMVAGDRNDMFGGAVVEFLARVAPAKATDDIV